MIFIKILENTIQIKNKKVLTVFDFDDMSADMFSNKKLYPIVTELLPLPDVEGLLFFNWLYESSIIVVVASLNLIKRRLLLLKKIIKIFLTNTLIFCLLEIVAKPLKSDDEDASSALTTVSLFSSKLLIEVTKF